MSEFGVVLVGVDGSQVAKDALVFAAREADRRGARLVVAHACRPGTHGDGGLEVRPFAEIVRAESVATLAELYPRLDYQVIQRDTPAADLLVELSAAADLLVVGTHRCGRARGFVLGSVSQRVAAQASCAVVTISGEPEHEDGPVVLGASTTPGGLAALAFACREAALAGAAVRAVRSVTVEGLALFTSAHAPVLDPVSLHAAARAELDTIVGTAAAEYPDVPVEAVVSEQDPFTALLEAAGDASLLVIGSRRGPDSALPHLGPVAAWLLHQAACPLAVVGAGPAAPDPVATTGT
ncbi:MAG: universal stress protein [Jatrophihabitans sp.]|nr:MAG: universal stress protein [Jatrophihabitans sp.]